MTKYSQKSIIAKVKRTILENQLIADGDQIILALSGGPDSVCLFDILFILQKELGFSLSACHYNHRLRGEESDRDQKFVEDLCKKKGIKLFMGKAPKEKAFKSEDEAREARYLFFTKLADDQQGAKIALAHHANDVAETFLMRILRGTGTRGLQSIPIKRDFFVRPFLDTARAEIEQYIAENHLTFVVDRTNLDKNFLRNMIRLEIIPKLEEINPNLIELLSSEAKTITSDYEFLAQTSLDQYSQVVLGETLSQIVFDAKKYLSLHPSMQFMILRLAVERLSGLKDLSFKQFAEVVNMVKKGEGNKLKILHSRLIIKLYGGKITLYK